MKDGDASQDWVTAGLAELACGSNSDSATVFVDSETAFYPEINRLQRRLGVAPGERSLVSTISSQGPCAYHKSNPAY